MLVQCIKKRIKDISFELEKGEIIAFIGPNGAGKYIIIKMLTGILYSDKFVISVHGISSMKDRKRLVY